jgi:1-acyl-sn-glycerol-3-phosphate acyltransferase
MRPWVYEAFRRVVVPLFRTVFRQEDVGRRHVPSSGGVVLASMHRSNWDPFVVGVPLHDRRMRFMAKAELYRVPGLRALLRAGGAFKVERDKADAAALQIAVELLRRGEVVMVFPEGTRNRDGTARPRTGAARLALRTGAPLVPAALLGTDDLRLLPPRLPRFAVAYGPPIRTDDLTGLSSREAARIATERWAAAVAELRADLERRAAARR